MILIEWLGISPIPQLIRRYIASGRDTKFLSGVSGEDIMDTLNEYINLQENIEDKNIDRVYDAISVDELESIFKTIERRDSLQKGKSGLDDCMQDDTIRISTEQEATRVVKETVINIGKTLNQNDQQK